MKNFDQIVEKIKKIIDKKGNIYFENVDLSFDQLKAHLIQNFSTNSFRETPNEIDRKKFILDSYDLPKIKSSNFHSIEEITFKRSNGNSVKIGGDISLPFSDYIHSNNKIITNPNPTAVTFDVFDMKISLPKIIKNAYKEVLTDPAGWAELAEKYGAELITLHFVSTDPGVLDTPISKAREIFEEVLERVKCPVIIGGSGNKRKDTKLFEELAAISQGERLMLSSADKITWDKIIPIAKKFGHNVLLWAQLDVNDQTKLVEDALAMGMPRNQIVLDPTCATLGYGLEYSFSIYQQIRLAGLSGVKTLNFPLSGGTTNAWGGREAWMKKLNHMPNFGGDRALRGPLWEITTALTMSMVGLNLAMMLHPLSAHIFKEIIKDFTLNNENPLKSTEYLNWVSQDY